MAAESKVARAFAGMMEQKLKVLDVVRTGYTSVCPIVGASVGQHVSVAQFL